jgi:N6-adenosine-specific RNA methylase IME4
MRKRGLIHPITLRPHSSTGFILVAGWHRYLAAEQLGWESIWARILDEAEAVEAEIVEIDENLIRADLSPAEQALHYGRRKELYDALHPETKHGGAPGAGKGKGKKKRLEGSQNENFVKETAQKTGKSRATVARDVARAKNVIVLADVVGTNLDQRGELDALGKLSAVDQHDLAERAKAGGKVSARTVVKRRRREEREKALADKTESAASALGRQLYSVIYADPPWRFEPYSRETGLDRAADNHYQTMAVDEICALKIPAAPDSILFCWATVPMLPQALEVMAASGFAYKSAQVWIKNRAGTGYWFRNEVEFLLVGTKGNIPAPAMGEQPSQVVHAQIGRHSEKSTVFAETIERMFPNLRKLEMFARKQREGWDTCGNEVGEKEAAAAAIPEQAHHASRR